MQTLRDAMRNTPLYPDPYRWYLVQEAVREACAKPATSRFMNVVHTVDSLGHERFETVRGVALAILTEISLSHLIEEE